MRTQRLNGCHNHLPYADKVWVQDGWEEIKYAVHGKLTTSRTPVMKLIPNPMKKECDYTTHIKTNGDPGCNACIWKTDQPTK